LFLLFLKESNESLLKNKNFGDTHYDYRNWTKTRSWCIRSY
jgi:hypothetical protein